MVSNKAMSLLNENVTFGLFPRCVPLTWCISHVTRQHCSQEE